MHCPRLEMCYGKPRVAATVPGRTRRASALEPPPPSGADPTLRWRAGRRAVAPRPSPQFPPLGCKETGRGGRVECRAALGSWRPHARAQFSRGGRESRAAETTRRTGGADPSRPGIASRRPACAPSARAPPRGQARNCASGNLGPPGCAHGAAARPAEGAGSGRRAAAVLPVAARWRRAAPHPALLASGFARGGCGRPPCPPGLSAEGRRRVAGTEGREAPSKKQAT